MAEKSCIKRLQKENTALCMNQFLMSWPVLPQMTFSSGQIYNKGGNFFGFLRLDPLGCIPFSRALKKGQKDGCFEEITPYVKLHNEELPKLLQKLETELKGFRYSLSNYNEFLSDGISNPSKYVMVLRGRWHVVEVVRIKKLSAAEAGEVLKSMIYARM